MRSDLRCRPALSLRPLRRSRRARHLLRLGVLLAICTTVACRGAELSTSAPEDPYWESAHGHPGNPVVVAGRAWAIRHERAHEVLSPDVRLVGLVLWDERWKHPSNERLFVRSAGGRIVPVDRRADLSPHLAPITDGDAAVAYVRFLQLFFPQGLSLGLPPGGPERYGVIERMMEEDLRAEGIDPTPVVEAEGDAIVVRRLVVVRDDQGDAPRYRLVRVRERVGRDGRYEASIEQEITPRTAVEDWMWRPL